MPPDSNPNVALVAPASGTSLTVDEQELQQCYETMSPSAQTRLLVLAREFAKNFPNPKKAALLTLVKNSTKTKRVPRSLNRDLNHPPVLLIR